MKGITLIGMPGAGKSTIGKMLAKELGFSAQGGSASSWKFVDLDILIKEKEGRSHADILEKDGTEALLNVEEKHALDLDLAKTVFSPGGSIIYSPEAMEKIKNETKIIYLELPMKDIKKRLGKNIETRGIVGLKEKGIDDLFAERTPLYESFAHYTISCLALTDKSIVNKIINLIQ